jgi:hypothetical protein
VAHEERVVGWIAASAIASSALIQLFVDFDTNTIANWAFGIARDAGLYVGGITLIVGGIRAIRRETATVVRVFQFVIGLALFGLLIGGPLATRHILLSSRDTWSRDIEPVYAEKVRSAIDNPLIPMEKRSFASSVFAAEVYAKTGEIISVISANGETGPYEPDDRARALRRNILETRSIAESRLPHIESRVWFGAVVLLASVAAGLISTIEEPVA